MAGDNLLTLDQTRLDGRFKLLRPLGAGHVGVVYEALDVQKGAKVALKKLRNVDPDALGRFRKEFRALQDLQHPNLIGLGELFTRDGEWFLTMDLVEGVDFLEWVRPEGMVLDVDRLREALGQLARGLNALHAAKKVHRDVKPSNIRVTAEGRPVLLDFGFVKDLGASGVRSDARIVGTIDYMAPEQAASHPVGPAADWYSVGVLLYQALTGKVPISGHALDVISKKQSFVPHPPSRVVRGVPQDLDQLCVDLLHADPRARPAGSLVLKRLGLEDSTPIRKESSGLSPFIGREDELLVLRAAWDKSRSTGATVVIHGASGVGKSELVRHFLDEISGEHPEPLALRGRCYERESVPYKGVDDVIDALTRHLKELPTGEAASLIPEKADLLPRVFPVMSGLPGIPRVNPATPPAVGVDPRALRAKVFQSLRELFLRLSQRYPVVIAIDDLQWADADTLALLGEVLRPPRAPALLLLITMRQSEDSAALDLRALSGDLRRVHLGGLPEHDARLLAATLLGSVQPGRGPEAARIAAEAGGHPLFIQELVRHSPGAGQLEDAIWERTRKLSAPARTILELCALASRPLAQEVAAGAAKVELADLSRHVALLRAGNLVRTSGPGPRDLIEPYHDRVRESVLARLDAPTRRERHARLAMSLEILGRADAEALWLHWREAGESAKAAEFVEVAAAQAASALAFDRAATLYRVALELGGRPPSAQAVLQEKLAEVLACGGRGPEAALAYLKVAEAGGSLTARRRAADQLLRSGHVDAGLATYGDILEASGFPRAPGRARLIGSIVARRLWLRVRGYGFRERRIDDLTPAQLERIDTAWSVSLGLTFVEPVRSYDFQQRHMILALAAGEPMRVARSLALESCFCSMLGGSAMKRAQQLAAQARAVADRCQQPYALGWAIAAEANYALCSDEIRRGATLLGEAQDVYRSRLTDVAWEINSLNLLKQWCQFQLGDLHDLRATRRVMLPEAEAKGDLWAEIVFRTGIGSFDLLADGDPAEVRRQTEDVMARWSRKGGQLQDMWATFGLGQADLYEGRGADAVARLEKLWPDLKASQQLRFGQLRTLMVDLRARSLIAAAADTQGSERERLLGLAERDVRALAREPARWPRALSVVKAAGVAAVRGDRARASALYLDADRLSSELGLVLVNATVRRRLAVLTGGDHGRALLGSSDLYMREQQVADPERMTAILAPGPRQ